MTTFSYDGAVIQFDTIAATGTYHIVASGGEGGISNDFAGGLAASSGGDIFLQAGAVLEIVVGGEGGSSDGSDLGAGGGGGSFVIEVSTGSTAVDSNEVIAGGGGGAGFFAPGGPGRTAPTGGNGGGTGAGAGGVTCAAGTGGLSGGGGGGFAGGDGARSGGTGGSGIAGGSDFAGGLGGANGFSVSTGGFGGGGGGGSGSGAHGFFFGGGGGGGSNSNASGGGGGGSYVNPLATAVRQSAGVHSGNGLVEIDLLCYLRGTHILTPAGKVPVECLAVGDMVVSHRGETRPITWIGTGKVLATRGRRTAATPVIVRKGALADSVPNRDLYITKGHSLYFDGVLIPVEFLVNHRSIVWDDHAQEVEIYHVELATHDVLLANGAPAESYRDDGNRWLFRNANSGWDQVEKPPCAPVLTGGGVVDAVWRRLLDRAGPRPGLPLSDDPDLHVMVDGARVDAVARCGSAYVFRLPALARSVRIVSRAAAPAELGLARDPRVLGVALSGIVLRQGSWFRAVDVADPVLSDGFHGFEPDNGLRWTDGDAGLPASLFDDFEGSKELVLHVGATTSYPLLEKARAVA